MSDFISNWGNVTKILQMLQAIYSKQRFSDVCEFLKDNLCSRCAPSWNKEHVACAGSCVFGCCRWQR